MDLEFSQEDFEFQQEVRAWIDEKYPQEMRQRRSRSPGGSLSKDDYVYWQQALYDNGWSGVNWPKEYGGPCFTATQQYLYDLEMSAAGTPAIIPFGQKYGGSSHHEVWHPGSERQIPPRYPGQ